MAQDEPRSRILNAAGPIFAEKGFQRTTVREICQAAAVNVASVNYYFGDKETLYVQTVRMARQSRASQFPMPSLSSDVPPEIRLRQFARTLLSRMVPVEDASWQIELMTREILRPTHACAQMVQEYFRPEFDQLMGILDELVPADTPRHVRQQLGFTLVGQCLFYRVAHGVVAMLVPSDEQGSHFTAERLAEHVAQVVLSALGHEPPLASEYAALPSFVGENQT